MGMKQAAPFATPARIQIAQGFLIILAVLWAVKFAWSLVLFYQDAHVICAASLQDCRDRQQFTPPDLASIQAGGMTEEMYTSIPRAWRVIDARVYLPIGLVALVYFDGVTRMQSLFTSLGEQQFTTTVALSTLLITALFNPLRRRIQEFIDRRFYRQKYNVERALAEFAAAARSETEVETLTGWLTNAIDHTLQPAQICLWLAKTERRTP